MVKKKSLQADVPAHKKVTVHHHHAKPYRKRHLGLLFIMIASFVMLLILLVQYRDQVITGLASSRSYISDVFSGNKSYDVKVESSYGYSLSYDQKQFYASAISGSTGDLYIGSELGTERAYNIVRVAPNWTSEETGPSKNTALTLTFHPGTANSSDSLTALALQDGGIDTSNVKQVSNEQVLLGGQLFQKMQWQSSTTGQLPGSLTAKFTTYAGLVRGSAVTIVIAAGVSNSNEARYDDVLRSLTFNVDAKISAAPTEVVATNVAASRSILDIVTNTSLASAATNDPTSATSEQISALYSPAVAKIYNAYCMDIMIDAKPYLTNYCGAASGSGFFVSNDGYIGTNGHVAVTTPLDIIIGDALTLYATKGDPRYFNQLMNMTKLKPSDVPADATDKEKVGLYVDAMYTIDTSRITVSNNVQNLLVGVTRRTPDITALIKATNDRKAFSGDENVVAAKVAAYDYRANDGYNGFKASDVAIIKVEGSNFPVVKLGSIDTLRQGADLLILGYPGNASTNGIVESTSSDATLTTGKVSAIKNASGSDKKLIETDTTIGHGNSGGPAIDSEGDVVGIATYTADGSGSGDGVYNYIRDIKDFQDLVAKNNISIDTTSKTQDEWQKGIDNFYSSHYSKAVKNFQAVQTLYPNHSRAADLITAAQKRIAEGKDVVDFPLIPVIIFASILLIGSAVTVVLIVRHHKKHVIYATGVAQGTVQPTVLGDPSQAVNVATMNPVVSTPVVLEPLNGQAASDAAAINIATPPAAVVPVAPVAPVTPAPLVETPTVTPPPVEPTPEQDTTTPPPQNPFL